MNTLPATSNRIDAIDALRGFALAGITLTHMLEQFIGAPRPSTGWGVEPLLIDNIILGLGFVLLTSKFFSMFALLFGVSFAIMMDNAAKRGDRFTGRFLWRLVILMGFGLLHSLFYRGDILSVYALLGMLLPFFYRMPDKWLWSVIILLFFGLGRILFFALTGEATLMDYELTPEAPEVAAYIEILKSGSLADVVHINLVQGLAAKYDFQYAVIGRGYITFAFFLVGMWLVRRGIAQRLDQFRSHLKKLMWWSLACVFVFAGLLAAAFALFVANPETMASWEVVLPFAFYDLANAALTSFFICLFLRIYLRKPHGRLRALQPYGRMALTNYLTQSLIGVTIFYGFGIGLVGKLHDWQTLLLGIAIIWLQIRWSALWLRHFRYGPLEWLWRSATYLRLAPFRKTTPQADRRDATFNSDAQ